MRGFGFKDNGFFICTETTPRCYVIQEVSDVNRAIDDLNKGTGQHPKSNNNNNNSSDISPPFLPWWFTSECRQQLLNVAAPIRAPTPSASGSNGYEPSVTPEPPGGLTAEQLRLRLKSQLEYYFSRENLMNDRYLRSQMDSDQYVSIKIVASFPKIIRLTTDYELIVAVLRESTQVQVDDAGEKVRPVTKRCTIILREIPEDADENEVKAMFEGCPPYQSLSYAANNSWYVSFNNEEDTQKAFLQLQNTGKTFNNKPVYARIKTGGAPIISDSYTYGAEDKITTNAGTAYKTNVGITPGGETVITGQITVHEVIIPPGEATQAPSMVVTTSSSSMNSGLNGNGGFSLGQILANYGYVPRASFRPSVTSTAAVVAAQQSTANSSNTSSALAFTTPTVPHTMPMSMISQQPRFLSNRSNVPFVKCPSTETAEPENNRENAKDQSKKSTTNSNEKSTNNQGERSGRPPYSSTSTFNPNYKSTSNTNRSNTGNQQSSNFNTVTPLNKVNTQDPNRTTTTAPNVYKESSYSKRDPRDYRTTNVPSERRERAATSQTGRSDQRSTASRPSNQRGEKYDYSGGNSAGVFYPASKPTQRTSTDSTQQRSSNSNRQYNSNRDYYQQPTSNPRHSQHQYYEAEEEQLEPSQDKNPANYDFVETDFPRLVEKEFKRQNSKQAANPPKEEKVQFSAVVAGRKIQKVPEEKRHTYAQTLKRSTNSGGHSDSAE